MTFVPVLRGGVLGGCPSCRLGRAVKVVELDPSDQTARVTWKAKANGGKGKLKSRFAWYPIDALAEP